jgi:predicted ATPase
MINEQLLNQIYKKLYDVESSVEASKYEFEQHNIKNIDKFLKTIQLYINSFNLLKTFKNENLLKLLNEKLEDILCSYEHINLYVPKIKSAINFIEKHIDTFFPLKIENTPVEFNKSIPPKRKISFLNNISIKNFFSIKQITLTNLKNKEIYIVGENGDGKTLLLQAIAVGLKGTVEDGLKEFRSREDEFTVDIENKEDIENNFFAYGASRNNDCPLEKDRVGYLTLFKNRYYLNRPEEWLIDIYNAVKSKEETILSISEAKELLTTLLEKDIEIDITYNKVIFKEKGSEVSFDQLSAGYKSVITIVCDLIIRFSEKQQVKNIAGFQGVVLIDEIELHLHPKWKYNFMKKLRDTFPEIQFIVTTHSPTVILGASKEAVFYKIYKEDGETKISDQIPNRGYTNNTLVSSPLFNLDTMTSRHYDKRKLSEDDYVYELIHEVVSKKIKEDVNLDEEAILKLIEEEFAKHDKN